MKMVTIMMLTFLVSSCQPQTDTATTGQIATNKKMAYNCHCAQAVCDKKLEVKGDENITFEKDNMTYCFSSIEEKNKFIQDLDKNIERANKNWLETSSNKDI